MEVAERETSLSNDQNEVIAYGVNVVAQTTVRQEQKTAPTQEHTLPASIESPCLSKYDDTRVRHKHKSAILRNIKDEARMQTQPQEALALVETRKAVDLLVSQQEQWMA
ncbi:hypothetical protein QJS10_CPB18g00822 [Acorus calamus]|uniref:Uncharacterized protein n=1 Tax=Acorus calamus TaxID=4465 RepID=A0AAV9CJY1_ACOCL|nr:hypothetical protein QJS10_CPB18g00822 [Acorus calamus]